MDFLDQTLLDIPMQAWLTALGVSIVTFLALLVIQQVFIVRLEKLTTRTKTQWDDLVIHALRKTKLLFLIIVSVFGGSVLIDLPSRADTIIRQVSMVALLIQAGIWLSSGLLFWLKSYRERELEDDPAAVTTMNAIGFVGRLILWSLVLLLTLDNLGVDITALVAGLGVGGIAVALAVQNILGDLFSSLSIVLDKPFVIGDFLVLGDHMGSVEYIGLKTTRVRSLSGEQLVFANTDLLKSRIRNYGRMAERRVVFTIGVTYQTPREHLKLIPEIIRRAIEAQEQTRFDRSHFRSYGDFALNFETVYYVLDPAFGPYMDIQQAVNLAIHEAFEEKGIEFAYPTQTLFVMKETA